VLNIKKKFEIFEKIFFLTPYSCSTNMSLEKLISYETFFGLNLEGRREGLKTILFGDRKYKGSGAPIVLISFC
jgi:hypothetical protein